jgi:hypothetical protein
MHTIRVVEPTRSHSAHVSLARRQRRRGRSAELCCTRLLGETATVNSIACDEGMTDAHITYAGTSLDAVASLLDASVRLCAPITIDGGAAFRVDFPHFFG